MAAEKTSKLRRQLQLNIQDHVHKSVCLIVWQIFSDKGLLTVSFDRFLSDNPLIESTKLSIDEPEESDKVKECVIVIFKYFFKIFLLTKRMPNSPC